MENNCRQTVIKELRQFINESKSQLNELLTKLGWDEETTLKRNNTSQSRLRKNDEEINPECSKHSIILETETVRKLIGEPKETEPLDESIKFLTAGEKLAIYEYCIQQTGKLSEPELSVMANTEESGTKKMMTFAEIVAQKRNKKRRTTRYRTGAPQPYVTELKNLIELQMSALSQYGNRESDNLVRERKDKTKFESERNEPTYSRKRDYHGNILLDKYKKHWRKSPKRHRSRDRR